MHVQHEADERPLKLRAHAFVDGKALAGNLRRPLEVDDVQALAYLPVGLRGERELPRLADDADDYVVVLVLADRRRGARDVGDVELYLLDFDLDLTDAVINLLYLVRYLAHLLDLGRGVLFLLLEAGHLMSDLVSLLLEAVALDEALPPLLIHLQEAVERLGAHVTLD